MIRHRARAFATTFLALSCTFAVWAGFGVPAVCAAAGEPRVHLTWHAPYGLPGATTVIDATCGDSLRRDTLYVSFQPTQYESTFVGVGGEIYVYAQPGDTLGSFWDVGRGGKNHGGMIATFRADESIPGRTPWNASGTGAVGYDRTPSSGRFKFGAVLAMDAGMPLEKDQVYVAGRIVIFSKGRNLGGCDRPVCIEWRRADFLFGPRREIFPNYAGSCVVTRGPASTACGDHVPAWRPPGASGQVDVAAPDSASANH
jgi:hypothetical protein